jgi:hypothetical protein
MAFRCSQALVVKRWPIVMRTENAVDCFAKTRVELLRLANYVVCRAASAPLLAVAAPGRAPRNR